MQRQNTIVISRKGVPIGTWGSIVEICKIYNLPYWKLKSLKFPIQYKDYKIYKFPFRERLETKIIRINRDEETVKMDGISLSFHEAGLYCTGENRPIFQKEEIEEILHNRYDGHYELEIFFSS